jgi:hypothetical protein
MMALGPLNPRPHREVVRAEPLDRLQRLGRVVPDVQEPKDLAVCSETGAAAEKDAVDRPERRTRSLARWARSGR